MVNYSNGRIYKLVNDVDDKIYVGSTTSRLSIRKCQHKTRAKRDPNIRVYKHLNEVGWEHVDIVLVENYECKTKEQLYARERHWIKELKPELNMRIPTRTMKEYYEDNKEQIAQKYKEYYENNKEKEAQRQKKYREEHKEQIAQKYKEYYEDNKERLAEKKKEYYQDNKEKLKQYYANNKEKIAQQKKEHYEKNKAKINQKFNCECGGKYTHSHKPKHLKTNKHKKYLENRN